MNGRELTRSRRASQSWWWGVFLLGAVLACAAPADDDADGAVTVQEVPVRLGLEVLMEDSVHLISGMRVGLITNHTGIYWRDVGQEAGAPREAGSAIDALHDAPDIDLVALFGPEHGLRGEERAGARIESGTDGATGLPIHSLYGETLRPTPEMLEGVDVLLFDMQDVGARYYTYVSTMAYAMQEAGRHGIPFIVLDRPNPIRGDVVQGNVLDTAYSTFVGLYPVPMRHGMTAGELAQLYVGAFDIDVELHVIPMDGWRRDMTFHETRLPWVPPSPNMPSVESALAYPGTCLFEGTPLSVGRGTDQAFQWVGAPWLNGPALAEALNGYGIAGVTFQAVTFTPVNAGDGKFNDQEVQGVQLVPASTDYDAPRAAVAMLLETYGQSGANWSWREAHFDRLAGTDALRLGIVAGADLEELTAHWSQQADMFEALRDPYLIYR